MNLLLLLIVLVSIAANVYLWSKNTRVGEELKKCQQAGGDNNVKQKHRNHDDALFSFDFPCCYDVDHNYHSLTTDSTTLFNAFTTAAVTTNNGIRNHSSIPLVLPLELSYRQNNEHHCPTTTPQSNGSPSVVLNFFSFVHPSTITSTEVSIVNDFPRYDYCGCYYDNCWDEMICGGIWIYFDSLKRNSKITMEGSIVYAVYSWKVSFLNHYKGLSGHRDWCNRYIFTTEVPNTENPPPKNPLRQPPANRSQYLRTKFYEKHAHCFGSLASRFWPWEGVLSHSRGCEIDCSFFLSSSLFAYILCVFVNPVFLAAVAVQICTGLFMFRVVMMLQRVVIQASHMMAHCIGCIKSFSEFFTWDLSSQKDFIIDRIEFMTLILPLTWMVIKGQILAIWNGIFRMWFHCVGILLSEIVQRLLHCTQLSIVVLAYYFIVILLDDSYFKQNNSSGKTGEKEELTIYVGCPDRTRIFETSKYSTVDDLYSFLAHDVGFRNFWIEYKNKKLVPGTTWSDYDVQYKEADVQLVLYILGGTKNSTASINSNNKMTPQISRKGKKNNGANSIRKLGLRHNKKQKTKNKRGGRRTAAAINSEATGSNAINSQFDTDLVLYTFMKYNPHKCVENTEILKDIAQECGSCNSGCCLYMNDDLEGSIRTVKFCRNQVRYMDSDEKYRFVRAKLTADCNFVESRSEPGRIVRITPKYHVGDANNSLGVSQINNVCTECFCRAYNCTPYFLRTVRDDIKNDYSEKHSGDSGSKITQEVLDLMNDANRAAKLPELTMEQILNIKVPDGHKSLEAVQWMNTYFDETADKMPNDEWQIEELDKLNVYEDFRKAMTFFGEKEYVSYTKFVDLWSGCFPQVKIKAYKQVSGKCFACSKFQVAKRKATTMFERNLIAALHAHHRDMYMGERREYYKQRLLAEKEPDKYMSIILDGMANHHTQLPWFANKVTFSQLYFQHLQGVIVHGSEFFIGRSFLNLPDDSNLAIHCLLFALERRLTTHGKLPDTIFIRIDGGSENANRYLLAVCELLVHHNLTKQVILSRLPVGHTHEDIDGKFGNIWNGIKRKVVATPQAYKAQLNYILNKGTKLNACVWDIFAVPDYKEWLTGPLSKISNWTKEKSTQLVWKFEKADEGPCEAYPLGVLAMYRAYSCDQVTEIVEDDRESNPIKLMARRANVYWHPHPKDYNGCSHPGVYILDYLPRKKILPFAFKEGSSKVLKSVVNAFRLKYHGTDPEGVKEWEYFKDNIAPQNDDVNEFITKENPLYVPLRDTLFIDNVDLEEGLTMSFDGLDEVPDLCDTDLGEVGNRDFTLGDAVDLSRTPAVDCMDCVVWPNRGTRLKYVPTRLELRGSEDTYEKAIYRAAFAPGQHYEELTAHILKSMCGLRGMSGFATCNKKELCAKLRRFDNGQEERNISHQTTAAVSTEPSCPEATNNSSSSTSRALLRDSRGKVKKLKKMTKSELQFTCTLFGIEYEENAKKCDLINFIHNNPEAANVFGSNTATTPATTTAVASAATIAAAATTTTTPNTSESIESGVNDSMLVAQELNQEEV